MVGATLPLVAPAIEFFAPGMPGTKGSARAFVIAGKARITNDNPKAKAWAAVVALAAREAMAGRPMFPVDVPLVVSVVFYLPRPLGHFGVKGLRPAAPPVPFTKPDGDKMLRATWDALTNIVFTDDRQIVEWPGGKRYADPMHPVGASISVRPWRA